MGGGGKSSTSSQTVSIPPEVLARYNAVNARAEDTAKQPFQQYGGEFVAGLNPTQQAGIQATSAASQSAQPYFGAATGLTLSGAQDVGPLTQQQIGYYQNPAMLATVAPTQAALQQQQGQQLSQQQSEAIKGGAFGGDRAGLQRQALRGQQQLGMGQALAPIYQQAYQTGLQTATGQQGVVAQDLARRMQAGQQIAGLGTGAQAAALQGAQAQIGAGTLGQQTQQAQDTAVYQQFLQERGYPFQVAQFLANIAEGTGALSGSTTTTTQPRGFFSNRGGFKTGETVKKAYGGGIDPNSMGGAVYQPGAFGRGGYATAGSVVDPTDLSAILAQQRQSFGPFAAAGPYGQAAGAAPHGPSGIVPQQQMHVPKLMTAGALPKQQPGGFSDISKGYKQLDEVAQGLSGKGLTERAGEKMGLRPTPNVASPDTIKQMNDAGAPMPTARPEEFGPSNTSPEPGMWDKFTSALGFEHGGGVMPRHHFEQGGAEDSQGDEAIPYDPSDVQGTKDPMEGVLKAGSQKPQSLKTAGGGGGGSGGGTGSDIMKGLGLAKTAMDVGSTAMEFLPAIFLKDGGVVPRQGYQTVGRVLPDDDMPEQRFTAEGLGAASDAGAQDTGIPKEAKGLMPAPLVDDQGRDLSPEALRQYTATRAKELGIDPKIPLAVWHGESGFNPKSVGDDKSSFNVTQLHYGNVSDKYPHAGVGDDFTKKTGLHASDLNATYPTIDYSLQHAAKNGWGDWTVARQLGYAGDKNAPRPPADIGRPTDGKALGASKEAGFFDGIGMNKQTILPLLQGLGAMASSKSISPWSAALQGLGAGAKAYGEEETRQAGTGLTDAQTVNQFMDASRKALMANPANASILMVLTPRGWMTQGQAQRLGLPTIGAPLPAAAGATALRRQGAQQAGIGNVGADQLDVTSATTPPVPKIEAISEAIPASQNKIQALSVPGAYYDTQARAAAQADAGSSNISAAQSEEVRKDIDRSVRQASENKPVMNDLTQNTAALIDKPLAGTGPFATPRQSVLGMADYASRLFLGKELPAGYDPSDLQVSKKLASYLAGQQTSAVNQNSLQAFSTALGAAPNSELSPKALANLTAMLMVQKSRAERIGEFARVFGEDAEGRLSANVVRQYDRIHGRQMQDEQNKLADFFVKYPKAAQKVASGEIPYDAAAQKFKDLYNRPDMAYHFQNR